MLDIDSVQITQEVRAGPMPHWTTIVHPESGLRVQGNCKNDMSIQATQSKLLDTLGTLLAKHEADTGKKFAKVQATEREQSLQAQLDEMRAMIAQMTGKVDPKVEAPKKRGRPKGWKKPEAAQVIDGPIPQVAFGEVPPRVAPPPKPLSKSKGSTVTRSNVDYIQP